MKAKHFFSIAILAFFATMANVAPAAAQQGTNLHWRTNWSYEEKANGAYKIEVTFSGSTLASNVFIRQVEVELYRDKELTKPFYRYYYDMKTGAAKTSQSYSLNLLGNISDGYAGFLPPDDFVKDIAFTKGDNSVETTIVYLNTKITLSNGKVAEDRTGMPANSRLFIKYTKTNEPTFTPSQTEDLGTDDLSDLFEECFEFVNVAHRLLGGRFSTVPDVFRDYEIGTCKHQELTTVESAYSTIAVKPSRHRCPGSVGREEIWNEKCFADDCTFGVRAYRGDGDNVAKVMFFDAAQIKPHHLCELLKDLGEVGYRKVGSRTDT